MSATIIFKDPGGYCKYKIKDTFYDTTSNFIYLSCVFLQPLVLIFNLIVYELACYFVIRRM